MGNVRNMRGLRTTAPAGRRGGSVLVLALIAVGMVAVLATSYLQLSTAVTRRQNQATDTRLAFYMAEAGLSEAYAGLKVAKTGNVGTPERPARFGNGLFWVTATDLGDDRVELESTGMVRGGRAILSTIAERGEESVTSLGIFSAGDVTIAEGSTVDGYDSRDGAYELQCGPGIALGAGRLGSNAAVTIRGKIKAPTYVDGDVSAGPGAQLLIEKEVTVTGTKGNADLAVELPEVEAPALKLSPGVDHKKLVPMIVLPGEVGLEYLTVSKGAEVVLQGPATVVIGELRVTSRGGLQFDTAGGAIDLYVTEALALEPGSWIATSSTDPSQVTVVVAGLTAAPVRLGAAGSFFGAVYAPEADVSVDPGFEVFGSLIAKRLEFTGSVRLHFDLYLAELAARKALPTFLSWRIVDLARPKGAGNMDPFRFLNLDPATLPLPADAHADQDLEIVYDDLAGAQRSFMGMEKSFSWGKVKKVKTSKRDGRKVNRGMDKN